MVNQVLVLHKRCGDSVLYTIKLQQLTKRDIQMNRTVYKQARLAATAVYINVLHANFCQNVMLN